MPSTVTPVTGDLDPSQPPIYFGYARNLTLSNGNLLVVGNGNNGYGTARLYSPTGTAIGNAIELGVIINGDFHLTALNGGGFMIGSITYPASQYVGRTFDSSGAQISGSIALTDGNVGAAGYFDLATLNNGNVAVTFSDSSGQPGAYARVFAPDGTPVTGRIFVSGTETNEQVVSLADGGFIVIGERTVNFTNPNGTSVEVVARRYSATGTANGSEIIISAPYYPGDDQPAAARLANGDVAIGWRSQSTFGVSQNNYQNAQDISVRILHPDNTMSDVIEVTRPSLGSVHWREALDSAPSVTALSNGGFAVAWQTQDSATNVQGQLLTDFNSNVAAFDSNGLRLSDNLAAPAVTVGQQFAVDVSGLANNGFAVTWGRDGTGSRFFAVSEVAGATRTGTTGADTLTGTDGNDIVTALAGDDILNGMGGADRMIGGTGNDTYYVDNRYDEIVEAAGAGTDTVIASASYMLTLGASVEAIRTIDPNASTPIDLTGNAYAQTITGNVGNNRLDGGLNNTAAGDTLIGGRGDDTYVIYRTTDVVTELANEGNDTVESWITYTLSASLENLTLVGMENLNGTGNAFDNIIFGNEGANQLYGMDGNDRIDGGNGNDRLEGGNGNDTYVVHNNDVVVEAANGGIDTIETTTTFSMSANVEILRAVEGAGAISLTGSGLADTLIGNSDNNLINGLGGDDIISGGGAPNGGRDTLDGGLGDDTITGGGGQSSFQFTARNFGNDRITDFTQGADKIDLSAFYIGDLATISPFISQTAGGARISWFYNDVAESITLTGISAASLTDASFQFYQSIGNSTVTGTAGADVLFGGLGNDNVNGGTGNDSISTGQGVDILDGGTGSDTLRGGAGNDTYYVDVAGDIIIEGVNEGTDLVFVTSSYTLPANVENGMASGVGNVIIFGNAGDNVLTGLGGNDVLVGGAGNDTIYAGGGANEVYGGTGSDIFIVSNAGDSIIEFAGEGIDEERTALGALTMAANIERLIYTGSASFVGTGNVGDNVIAGGSNSDSLAGGDGNDTLDGRSTVAGQEDALVGGLGDDVFIVALRGTTVVEYTGEGIDEVRASSSVFVLPNQVENLTYTGAGGFIGFGNALENVIKGGTDFDGLVGDAGNDTIYGGAGAGNELIGGTGNDTYVVEAGGDTIIEYASEGNDTVSTALANYTLRTNVENLVYTGTGSFGGIGTAENNAITGGVGADTLVGLEGNDVLTGGAGADLLLGGNGADLFRYIGNETGYDRILDFTSGQDRISISSAFALAGTLSFTANGEGAATTGNSTFTYNTNNGIVSYDADGTGAGAAIALAQLNTGLTLTLADFERAGSGTPIQPDFGSALPTIENYHTGWVLMSLEMMIA